VPARPYLGHGVGLRRRHYARALRGELDVDWVEAISENFFGEGGRPLAVLERVRRDLPVVLHGVSLGIGSPEPPPSDYLDRLRRLIARVEPAWVSDHLCWGHRGGVYSHELLPLPLTEAALDRVVRRVIAVQEALGRRIALENVSSYLTYTADAIPEWEFLAEVSRRADCRILLDLNNILVSAHNHGFDPQEYLAGIPGELVWQFHLARHSDRGAYRFDDHCGAVLPEVWALFEDALRRYGPVSSLVEWDEGVPPWEALRAEQREAARRAAAVLGEAAIPTRPPALGEAIEAARPVARGARELSETTDLNAAQAALWGALRSEGGSAAIRERAPELDRAVAEHIADTAALSRAARLDIYVLSGSWRLREALAHAYPTLAWLLGDARFDSLAARVIRDAPSRDPDLGRFGGGLPRILAATELAGDPWLVEVASLERAMTELLDAADPPPTLDHAALEAWSPERWPTLRVRPIPALRILDAERDVGVLWSLREADEDPEVAWAAAREGLAPVDARLIWRRDYQVFHRPLAAAEAATLRALVAGEPLASALDAALIQAPELAPATIVAWIRRWLDDRLFVA
jgi:hypothetical protein